MGNGRFPTQNAPRGTLFRPMLHTTVDTATEAAQAIRRHSSRLLGDHAPRAGLILGTGLGGLAEAIKPSVELRFDEIPGFRPTTAVGHEGRVLVGWIDQLPVVALRGRLHRYEGHDARTVAFPIRVFRSLGVQLTILSNASGGVRPGLSAGDILLIDDHIDLMGPPNRLPIPPIAPAETTLSTGKPTGNPTGHDGRPIWRGRTTTTRADIYDSSMIQLAEQQARELGISVTRGTYAALSGPNYETRAEYRMLRRFGIDVVGMSTAPEATLAAFLGMQVLALSVVTNVCSIDPQPAERSRAVTCGHDVVQIAARTAPRMRSLVLGVLDRWANKRSMTPQPSKVTTEMTDSQR